MTAVYLQLAAYACATTFSPGPNNILLFSSTSRYGIRKCWPLIFGIWAGLITVMLLCGFGCAWLGELVPQIVPVAKYVGAAYILYLAYRTLMRSPGAKKEAGPSGKPLSYVNGFLLQFLNVHILMLGIAAYSGYILPHGYTVPAVLCFSVIMAACAATGNLIWATLGALLYPLYSRYYKFVNAVMALLRLENHLRLRIHGPNALPSREGVFCAEQACPHLFILYNVGRARLRRHPGERFLGDREAVRQICEKFAQTGRRRAPDKKPTLSSK